MRKSAPFTKGLAFTLAVTLFHASVAGAASPEPGKLAVLEPAMPLPEMRAAWDGIRNEIYLDPLLLVRGREEVLQSFDEWHLAAQSVRSSYKTADRIVLERVENILESAWSLYYQFDYPGAVQVLRKGEELLRAPGDSRHRTHLMFEIHLLKGIVSRAAGEQGFISDFKRAAALDPSRELPLERYSPEIIAVYGSIRSEFLAGEKVSFSLSGTPHDATIFIGGKNTTELEEGEEFRVFPGVHFIEVSAPGYEPWSLTLDVEGVEPVDERFELLPLGPEGEPDTFFLQRLRAGDGAYMALLAEKLEVDYLLVPDPGEGVLNAWLLDREGRTVNHMALWNTGEQRESGALKAAGLLEPIRHRWSHVRTTETAPLSLPVPGQGPAESFTSDTGSVTWKKYALVLGVLLVAAAVTSADRSSATRIEATW